MSRCCGLFDNIGTEQGDVDGLVIQIFKPQTSDKGVVKVLNSRCQDSRSRNRVEKKSFTLRKVLR